MKPSNTFLAGALLIGATMSGAQSNAFADQDYTGKGSAYWDHERVDRIEQRLDNQRARIEEGYRSGQLTRQEFDALMMENHAIDRQERQYLANGQMTPLKYDRLERELAQASEHIFHENHDREMRGPRGYEQD